MIDLYDSDDGLDGYSALVTGGGSRGEGIGNGRAAAILLARRGARVAVLDVNVEWALATVEMIRAEGGEAFAISADVTHRSNIAQAVDEVTARYGAIRILVNNVGIAGPAGTAEEVDLDAWDTALRVNVTSIVVVSGAVIPGMRAAGGGSIVNMASVAGLTGGHPALLYPASKGAVVNMTRAMAAHHGADNIRVNCVAPGLVHTPMVTARGLTEQMRIARSQQAMLRTEGTGWDVGQAVLYLAGKSARWVTGVVLPVDAGLTAGPTPIKTPPRSEQNA
jgi:NAD(P)-dependent dehydrogenase (short-subunit alcohol dehydrogenase family)